VAVSGRVAPIATVAVAGATVTVVGVGVTGAAGVVTVAMFDGLPKTAFRFSVPKKEARRKSYVVDGLRPRTVHVSVPLVAVPLSGTAHVPCVALGEASQLMGEAATRTSYRAGVPKPLDTCVNDSVTEVGPVATAFSVFTVPSLPRARAKETLSCGSERSPSGDTDSPEHIASPGTRMSQANRRIWRRTLFERFCIGAPPRANGFGGGDGASPWSRRRSLATSPVGLRWWLGWRSDENRDSPVTLRRRLSTGLLWAASCVSAIVRRRNNAVKAKTSRNSSLAGKLSSARDCACDAQAARTMMYITPIEIFSSGVASADLNHGKEHPIPD
jgi:hypothetical protein